MVALTARDLAPFRVGGGYSPDTAGFAYVGGACHSNPGKGKVSGVALVEDSGGYSGVIVAAHEIAHLLGVVQLTLQLMLMLLCMHLSSILCKPSQRIWFAIHGNYLYVFLI